ncbi:MAG: hypothetical protein SVZ03_00165 [Spirochaetota bacterium]|nr:hypothetical protein [Spirochaetota bacterium]
MGTKRKKYIVDKTFQFRITFKAVLWPLIITLIIGSVLLYYAKINNNYTKSIVKTQDQMINLFLTTPALQNADNPMIMNAENTFRNNISMLFNMKKNSIRMLYFIIVMIVIQSAIIFLLFIFITHKISGPVYVMTQYLRELRMGNIPKVRRLREKDELQDFHNELCETIKNISSRFEK